MKMSQNKGLNQTKPPELNKLDRHEQIGHKSLDLFVNTLKLSKLKIASSNQEIFMTLVEIMRRVGWVVIPGISLELIAVLLQATCACEGCWCQPLILQAELAACVLLCSYQLVNKVPKLFKKETKFTFLYLTLLCGWINLCKTEALHIK